MAITIRDVVPRDTSVDEYLEYLDEHVAVDDVAGLMASAPMLLGLSQRKGLVAEVLNGFLSNYLDIGYNREVEHQSLILGVRGHFAIRLNIWVPARDSLGAEAAGLENRAHFYGIAHNHNFDFLTVGIHGAGYRTQLFECERRNRHGAAGERVSIMPCEETRLPEGKLMLYHAFTDVHIQHPPEELSMSLNVLVDNRDYRLEPQLQFDIEEGRILSQVHESRAFRMASIFDLAPSLANDKTLELLQEISTSVAMPRSLRIGALKALASCGDGDVQSGASASAPAADRGA